MAYKNPPDLRERAFEFACAIFDFCDELARHPGIPRRIAYQLFDAGTSIGSNLEEAKSSYSRREFASKNCLSLKESRETNYWLRLADAKHLGNPGLRRRLLYESNEFISMLTAGARRLQSE